nr:hypothetical protein [Acidimicrobiia bacterium]
PAVRSQVQPPASAAALRWLEGAFAGLRSELEALRGQVDQQQAAMAEMVSGVTQQQLMLSELLDTRDDDFRLIEFAEALPQLVSDAVHAEVKDDRARTVADVVAAVEESQKAADGDAPARDPKETAAELRAFLQNDPSTRSIVAAVATQAATRAMRAEVAAQLPRVLDQVVAASEARMNEVSARIEAQVAKAVRAAARAARTTPAGTVAPAPKDKAPAKPATRKAAPATKAKAPAKKRVVRSAATTSGRKATTKKALRPAVTTKAKSPAKRPARSAAAAKAKAPATKAARSATATTGAKAPAKQAARSAAASRRGKAPGTTTTKPAKNPRAESPRAKIPTAKTKAPPARAVTTRPTMTTRTAEATAPGADSGQMPATKAPRRGGPSARNSARARAVPPLSERDLEAELALLQPS